MCGLKARKIRRNEVVHRIYCRRLSITGACSTERRRGKRRCTVLQMKNSKATLSPCRESEEKFVSSSSKNNFSAADRPLGRDAAAHACAPPVELRCARNLYRRDMISLQKDVKHSFKKQSRNSFHLGTSLQIFWPVLPRSSTLPACSRASRRPTQVCNSSSRSRSSSSSSRSSSSRSSIIAVVVVVAVVVAGVIVAAVVVVV